MGRIRSTISVRAWQMRRIRRASQPTTPSPARQLRHLLMEIADAPQTFANDGEEFTMTVGEQVFCEKAAFAPPVDAYVRFV